MARSISRSLVLSALCASLLAAFAATNAAGTRVTLPKPTGSFWFHEPLPESRDSTQSVVFAGNSLVIPGVCVPAQATYAARGDIVEARASWDSCRGWKGSSAALVLNVNAETLNVLEGLLTVPGLGIFDLPVVATKGYGESLRLVTYNVQMLPSTFNATTDPENAAKISERIKASGYDVVVLNEAFDEDVQHEFVDELEGAFPYHIDYLTGDTVPNEDSGLMLFSRLPFQPLPDSSFAVDPDDCIATNCSRVAFVEFLSCTGDDCFSEKGVGFVRLRNPETGGPINVAFTHLQASYAPAEYPDELEDEQDAFVEYGVRGLQIQDINQLLVGTLGQARFDSEPVFVMGDLNIDGDLANPDAGWANFNVRNIYEWETRMPGLNGAQPQFFFHPLRDGWARDNAPKWPSGNFDRGITNISAWGANADGARLDYVLLNSEKSRLCVQHMTLSHNLRWSEPGGMFAETGFGPNGVGLGGERDLSDHYGVNADVNLDSPGCRPAVAPLLATPPGQIATAAGTIGRPGEIDWLRVDEPGTYSFSLAGTPGIDYRIYESTNMTTPVSQYKSETTDVIVTQPDGAPVHFVGEQFRISKAPFFIRVWHTDRTKTGSFTLSVLRHDCSKPELACALAPAERRDVSLLPTPPVSGLDEAWFELYTEAVPSGSPQYLRAFASEIDPSAAGFFELRLIQTGSPDTVIGSDGVLELDPAPQSPDTRQLDVQASEADARKYFLVVERTPASPAPYPSAALHFQVRWETDLTILFGAAQGGQSLQIRCLEENDGPDFDGDDEVYLEHVRADGNDLVGQTFLGDFDAGDPRDLEGVIPSPIHFFDDVEVRAFEEDDFAAGDVDDMQAIIELLDPSVQGPVTKQVAIDPDTGGSYRLYYNVTHGFDS